MVFIKWTACLLLLLSSTRVCHSQSDIYRTEFDSVNVRSFIETEAKKSFYSSLFNPFTLKYTAGLDIPNSIKNSSKEDQMKWILSQPLEVSKVRILKDSKSLLEGYEFYYISLSINETGFSAIFAVDTYLNVHELSVEMDSLSPGYRGFISSVINHAKHCEIKANVRNLYKYIEIESMHNFRCVCLWLGRKRIRKKYKSIQDFLERGKYACGFTSTNCGVMK